MFKLLRNSLAQYSILTFVCITALSLFLGANISRKLTDYMIHSHINIYPEIIELIISENNRDLDYLQDLRITPSVENSELFIGMLKFDDVFRIKIWATTGTILWSDNKEIIGKNFSNNTHFQKALLGNVNYEIEVPNTLENSGENHKKSILAIYVPLVKSGKVTGVVEVYEADQELYDYIDQNVNFVWVIISLFGGLLYCLQFGIFYRSYRFQKQTNEELSQTHDVTIFALAYQAELRDSETGKHLERTSAYVSVLAHALRADNDFKKFLTDDYIEDLVKSSLLHDIGKSGVSDIVLRKPGRLNEKEFAEIKTHCELGANILREAEKKLSFRSFLTIAIQLTLTHHEKWDGSGYPNGLKGQNIPLSGRIMAVADVYDALRSRRAYKDGVSHEKCVEIIQEERGKHFDPAIVDMFLKHEQEFNKISEELKELTGIDGTIFCSEKYLALT